MSNGTSTFVIRWINFLTMILGVGIICFGIWMGTNHEKCHKTFILPTMILGTLILLISLVGLFGAMKNIVFLLWVYLAMLFVILAAILVITVLAFIVTNKGSGHAVSGVRFKEYHLQDYNSCFLKLLNNTKYWGCLKSCFVKSFDCNNLPQKYKTLRAYKLALLTPIEAGCCRPPSKCGYPAINSSYYDVSYHPTSTDRDCKLYKNAHNIKCYDCDSCKAGVAHHMKTKWRVVAVFNVILFVILLVVYFTACCAMRNAADNSSPKEQIR